MNLRSKNIYDLNKMNLDLETPTVFVKNHQTIYKAFCELFISLNLKNKELSKQLKPKFIELVSKNFIMKNIYMEQRMYMEVPECLSHNIKRENFLYFLYSNQIDKNLLLCTSFNPYLIQNNQTLMFFEQIYFYFLYFDCLPFLENIALPMFRKMIENDRVYDLVPNQKSGTLQINTGTPQINTVIGTGTPHDTVIGTGTSHDTVIGTGSPQINTVINTGSPILDKFNDCFNNIESQNLENDKNTFENTLHCCNRIVLYNPNLKKQFIEKLKRFDKTGKIEMKNSHLLLRAMPVNKKVLGQALGKKALDVNLSENKKSKIKEKGYNKLLESYITTFDFQNLPLLLALRTFLNSFILPTESQQIERILEKFSDRYYECQKFNDNEKSANFLSLNVVNILTYMLIYLNTELHSPYANGMDKLVFIENVRECIKESILKKETPLKENVKKEVVENINQQQKSVIETIMKTPEQSDDLIRNRILSTDQNISDKYLSSIYDDIKGNPLKPNVVFQQELETWLSFEKYMNEFDIEDVKSIRENQNNENVNENPQNLELSENEKQKEILLDVKLQKIYNKIAKDLDFRPIDRLNTCTDCQKTIIALLIVKCFSKFTYQIVQPDDIHLENILRLFSYTDSVNLLVTLLCWFKEKMKIKREKIECYMRIFYCILTKFSSDVQILTDSNSTADSVDQFISQHFQLKTGINTNENQNREYSDAEHVLNNLLRENIPFYILNQSMRDQILKSIDGPPSDQFFFLSQPLKILNSYKKRSDAFFFKKTNEIEKMRNKLIKTISSGTDIIFKHFIEINWRSLSNENVEKNGSMKDKILNDLRFILKRSILRIKLIDPTVLVDLLDKEMFQMAISLKMHNTLFNLLHIYKKKDDSTQILKEL
ncbi:Pattern-formation protein/guanine nucleotide exchange factor, partial [Pseudoloma neurophilia]